MGNERKTNKTKINFWQDLLTFLLLLAVTLTAFTDTGRHKWLGVGIVTAVFIHLALHWRWLVTMGQRFTKKMPRRARFKLILDLALLIVFILLSFSGMIVALIYAPGVTIFHNLCFYLFAGLITLHLVLNWKWITNHGQRALIIPLTRFVAAGLGWLVAGARQVFATKLPVTWRR